MCRPLSEVSSPVQRQACPFFQKHDHRAPRGSDSTRDPRAHRIGSYDSAPRRCWRLAAHAQPDRELPGAAPTTRLRCALQNLRSLVTIPKPLRVLFRILPFKTAYYTRIRLERRNGEELGARGQE